MSTLLKVENNSSWVMPLIFWKNALPHARVNFHYLKLVCKVYVYMYVKFDVSNERLEWYKKRLIFAEWVTQNNSDALSATLLKWNDKNLSTWNNLNSFT